MLTEYLPRRGSDILWNAHHQPHSSGLVLSMAVDYHITTLLHRVTNIWEIPLGQGQPPGCRNMARSPSTSERMSEHGLRGRRYAWTILGVYYFSFRCSSRGICTGKCNFMISSSLKQRVQSLLFYVCVWVVKVMRMILLMFCIYGGQCGYRGKLSLMIIYFEVVYFLPFYRPCHKPLSPWSTTSRALRTLAN